MHNTLSFFYQNMPPNPEAVALRGQSFISSLAQLINREHWHLSVYCTTKDPLPIQGADFETLDVAEVKNTMSLKHRLIGEVRMGYVASTRIFRSGDMPSLAVISSPGYIVAILLTFFARLHRVPYVLDVRDIYPQVYAESGLFRRESVIYRLFQFISRWMYSNAELVLCATHGLVREIAREVPTARITCVYNGFPACLVDRRSNKHMRFTVCFHGVLGFFQDVETLLKVTDRLTQHEVDVVVIGYGRKEGPLKNCTLPNLSFLGRKSFEATISEVERCHVGLCLRLDDDVSRDAFPVKVWEYIGLALPCIVTPPCEAGDFLKKHFCGIVLESGDVDGIVTAVLRAKDDADYLRAMEANCRRIAVSYAREQTGIVAAQEIYRVALQCSKRAPIDKLNDV